MNGPVALITGASRGIGAATALELARRGYTVGIHFCSREERARNVAEQILAAGGAAAVFQADVSQPQEASKLVDACIARFGQLDVLVCNAGIAQTKLFDTITDAEWDQMIACDLSSVFYCCRAALPHMLNRKSGSIITVASMWGQVGASCEAHYAAAKGGVIALTRSLAKEAGPSGIRANCVAPGVIETDMLGQYTTEERAILAAQTPLGRLGTPQDVANAIAFFAGEEAAFLTGQILGVNGGFVI